MNIASSINTRPMMKTTTPMVKTEAQPEASNPQETFTFSDGKAGFAAFGAAVGGVTVGGMTALGMGAAKAFMNGSPLLGTGLAVGAAVAAPVAFFGFGTAVMSTTSGTDAGVYGFAAGGALATAGAAALIF